ncbi:uncharacterized protein J4E78_010620 [Alternaria triticimaculans]|uniref:uncharacterized protein n=1 Tax=Alternaria triticimaculans TaxID=297637 RepID=UPI0020C52437|nr:uncharacterized protein J4E78_010620 [Alternaria triticimaculans]KAI4640496.1 hypothetical protein J4E78_010620 [Alternaria triticimaculans]
MCFSADSKRPGAMDNRRSPLPIWLDVVLFINLTTVIVCASKIFLRSLGYLDANYVSRSDTDARVLFLGGFVMILIAIMIMRRAHAVIRDMEKLKSSMLLARRELVIAERDRRESLREEEDEEIELILSDATTDTVQANLNALRAYVDANNDIMAILDRMHGRKDPDMASIRSVLEVRNTIEELRKKSGDEFELYIDRLDIIRSAFRQRDT